MANIESANFDGAGDVSDDSWDAVVARRQAAGVDQHAGRAHADRMIRQQVEQIGQGTEGGGLLVPLDERLKSFRGKKRKVVGTSTSPHAISTSVDPMSCPSSMLPASRHAQYDGVDESDEDEKAPIVKHDSDEDAINSDLDDPNDNVGEEEEEDEGAGQIMLCTYDKVQRVKNKWKCTLKDGVLTTNGKEFVTAPLLLPTSSADTNADMSSTKLKESLNGSRAFAGLGAAFELAISIGPLVRTREQGSPKPSQVVIYHQTVLRDEEYLNATACLNSNRLPSSGRIIAETITNSIQRPLRLPPRSELYQLLGKSCYHGPFPRSILPPIA